MLDSTTVMDLQRSLPIHAGDVHCIAVHKDVIATTSGSSLIRVFSVPDLKEKSYSPLQLHKYHVIHCAFTSDGKKLVSTSMDGKASIVEVETGKLLAYHQQPGEVGMRTCCLSNNDKMMAVGACDGTIGIIEMDSYKSLKTMSVNDDESILSLCFTPDAHWLLSGHSVTGDIRVWNAQYLTVKPVASQMTAHELGTHYLQMSPKYTGKPGESQEGIQFVSAGVDCLIGLWKISYPGDGSSSAPTLTKLNTLMGHTGPVYCVQYSGDGDTLASCGGDFTVRLWNLEGECLYVHVDAHTSFINSCAFSVDNAYLYTASCDRTVKIWAITDTYNLKDVGPTNDAVAELSISGPAPIMSSSFSADDLLGEPSLSSTLNSWTVDDVCQWLSAIGLSKHSGTFRLHDIDGEELKQLSKEILEKEMGISAFGARNKIMRALGELLSAQARARDDDEAKSNGAAVTDEFFCSITHELMSDPVVAADGFSYERLAIESWLAQGNDRSPKTNAILSSNTILPNHSLKILINNHRRSTGQ